MSFTPATAEQRFALEHIAGISELSEAATPDLVDAVLEGAGAFAAGEWAPLDRAGDTVGAKWTPEGVKMPAGYPEAYKAYVEGGWGTIGSPEAYGGQGLPFTLATAVLETLGTANTGFALCPTLNVGAIESLVHHGTPEQQDLWLPKLSTGEWTGTMNLTEPQAGSDVGALKSRATPRADGKWSITGTKIFISFGDHDMADNIVHLVLARTPDAPPGTKGISLFLVPKYRLDANGNPGEFNDVRVVSIEHKMGLHASPTCVLSFGDNGDCVGELIGPELGGMRAMFTMMNNARLNVGLQGVQVAERATQRAVAYARERVQSARAGHGREPVAIIEHPDVRRMLMRMKAQTMAARALVYLAASMVDRANAGEAAAKARLELLTPLAKAHGTDIGNEVASLGVQVHGGMGYIEETGAAQHFRDARITPIYEGTNGIQAADLVGRKLSMDNGGTLFALTAQVRSEAQDAGLIALIEACEEVGRHMLASEVEDRLAGSYPFLTMLSVAVCGWLMEKQCGIAASAEGDPAFLAMKQAAARFYVEQIVPEAMGLKAAALADADVLYSINAETFAA
ncbi:acyl-CoA dehydrogenase [Sphingomonas koreensis]|uniref:acyl-CoA dehydrogenase n=1 Tax=Sphingomonas koreensis TaxID=93064 RepID=UPI000829ACFD|nr:acyl-CoA dehydrogenase [Sphingomonas koreensis]PJI88045.1 alkylation response protein AidB-like acyl-CoA dehydrogenase [Sphingomonas koreensis]RSU57364.1 acyl-CoA dehydrogenase [Sphingomonas koreensis]RSU65568.1 acyl-CoA dehydrogenase [Sphingomonas koreensis]